jgi:hypothetical protein
MKIEQAETHAREILQKTAGLPKDGLRRNLRQPLKFPVKATEKMLQLFRQIRAHPNYVVGEEYLIHRLNYDLNSPMHRAFARAFGRSSSKRREIVTVHLEILPTAIVKEVEKKRKEMRKGSEQKEEKVEQVVEEQMKQHATNEQRSEEVMTNEESREENETRE